MESPGQRIIRLELRRDCAQVAHRATGGTRLTCSQAPVQLGVVSRGKPSALGWRLRMRGLGSTRQSGRSRSAQCG